MTVTEYFSPDELMVTSNRGWVNLNKLAKLLLDNQATENNPMTVNGLARIAGMDTSQVARLVNDRPGFVKVQREVAGGRALSVGVYYLPEIKELAGADYYPQKSTTIAVHYLSTQASLPKTVMMEGALLGAITFAEPKVTDKYMAQASGDATLTVHTRKEVRPLRLSTIYNTLANDSISFERDAKTKQNGTVALADMDTAQLENIRILLANHLDQIASLYRFVSEVHEEKIKIAEVK